MAKIKVIQATFSDYLKENANKTLVSLFLGESLDQALEDVPNERPLWIDTKYVRAVSEPTKVKETGDVVFQIYFDTYVQNENNMWIKGECFKELMEAWIASD